MQHASLDDRIHACVTPRHAPFAHFILSTTPRGGFSGGPAIYEDGYALGIVTRGLVMDNLPLENGFEFILFIERISIFLDEAGLTPEVQKNVLNELMAAPSRTP